MSLPTPSNEALVHQKKLLTHLADRYRAQSNQLSFAEFMQIALYAPGLGYYSAGSTKFGPAGDFVTAPEISGLFSQCVANQCEQILHSVDSNGIIVELGAGSGKMASDILTQLQQLNRLPEQYWILEVSADLRQRQQSLLKQHLPKYIERIRWLDALPEQPFNGIILANEVLDAMPVHVFKIGEQEILEGQVQPHEDKWQLVFDKAINPNLVLAVQQLQTRLGESFAKGYTSEINLDLDPFIRRLSQCLQQGTMLFIDYGFPSHEYYHPSRDMGTLMCHYRHHAHSDPMQYIGLQDITAHVDFTALAIAGHGCGLDVAGFTHQAGFLLDNGLLTLPATQEPSNLVSQQIQRLTQPHEMGELFKVLALTKNLDIDLQGFSSFDQRHRL